MKLVFKNFDINYQNISFAKIKKNIIIEGSFTRIIYSDTFVTINGIYILTPLLFLNCNSYEIAEPFYWPSYNKELNRFEGGAAEVKDEFLETNCKKIKTYPEISITEDRNIEFVNASPSFCEEKSRGDLTDFTEAQSKSKMNLSEQSVEKYEFFEKKCREMYFYPYIPDNLFITKKILEIETNILNYYKDFYEIKKKAVLNLFNLLNIKEFPGTKCRGIPIKRSLRRQNKSLCKGASETKDEIIGKNCKENLPSHATANWYSPERSVGESFNIKKYEKTNVILKISGIWETSSEVGLTYKFIFRDEAETYSDVYKTKVHEDFF
jgi:hypothetical protein